MTFQSPVSSQITSSTTAQTTTIESPQLIELSEVDLATISAGGWFKKLTGISTPKFLKKLDDNVRKNVKGGWFGVAGTVLGMSTGVAKPF